MQCEGAIPRHVVAGERVARTHRHAILIRQASAGRSTQGTRWRILKILFVHKMEGVVLRNDPLQRALILTQMSDEAIIMFHIRSHAG